MKKGHLIAMLALVAAGTAGADPTVTGVSLTQENGLVEVTYTLDEKAVVTVDFLVNDVSIGAKRFAGVCGDVNRVVAAGTGKISWMPGEACRDIAAGKLKAKVTAWSLKSPPDYMVIQAGYPKKNIRFYVSADALPDGGLANRIYARDRLVMRKIPSKNVPWRQVNMKAGLEALDLYPGSMQRERPSYVKFTYDYYMSVYLLTQGQVKNFGYATTASSPQDPERPWNGYKWVDIRGGTDGILWPGPAGSTLAEAHSKVDDGSLIKMMRTSTGISSLDLPTFAEFEFACRAGTQSNFYNGSDTVTADMTKRETLYAWYKDFATTPQPVGLLAPNPWGLYDMTGNVFCWILDRLWGNDQSQSTSLANTKVDPRGTEAGVTSRYVCSGPCKSSTIQGLHASAASMIDQAAAGRDDVGARVACSADLSADL